MGALFAKKKVVWVPVNEKLEDKCSYPEGWAAVESFRGWKVCNDGGILAKAMAKCSTCGNLDLSYCGLGDNEAKEVAKAIAANMANNKHDGDPKQGTFKKINLSFNAIHAEGVEAICKALTPPPRTEFCLEELDLTGNYAGPRGAEQLGALIKSNRILRKVSLKNNNIGNQGVLAFLGGISTHHKESKFDIRHNMIDLNVDLEQWEEMSKTVKKCLGPGNVDADDNEDAVILGWSELGLSDV